MGLPVRTTVDDARRVVAFLKSKSNGASIADVKAVVGASHLDPRKVHALEYWRMVRVEGYRLWLTDEGRTVAQDPARAQEIFRATVDVREPYRAVVEWAYHQQFEQLGVDEVAAHWRAHHGDEIGVSDDPAVRDSVACFFNLAEAAGLGIHSRVGGSARSRFTLDQSEVAEFIEHGTLRVHDPDAAPATVPPDARAGRAATNASVAAAATEGRGATTRIAPTRPAAATALVEPPETEETVPEPDRISARRARQLEGLELQVYISHGQGTRLVEQVQTLLRLADIPSEVADEEGLSPVPVPPNVMSTMRRCNVGVIVVTADESRRTREHYVVDQSVLIEIGAAYVLYEGKVVLLWDRRLQVPGNLAGMPRCDYSGDEIGWDSGVRLMKAMNAFKG